MEKRKEKNLLFVGALLDNFSKKTQKHKWLPITLGITFPNAI